MPVIFVGCSWGGLVAGEFAIDHPARTRAVVMLNTPVHHTKNGLQLSDRFVVWGARWLHASRVYQDGVARSFFLPKTCASTKGRVQRDTHFVFLQQQSTKGHSLCFSAAAATAGQTVKQSECPFVSPPVRPSNKVSVPLFPFNPPRYVRRDIAGLLLKEKRPLNSAGVFHITGGDRGIRTLDTGLSPYASLAGKCLRPLGQVSTCGQG